MVYPLARVD